ncbi:unnamed protein product [Brassica oleracea]
MQLLLMKRGGKLYMLESLRHHHKISTTLSLLQRFQRSRTDTILQRGLFSFNGVTNECQLCSTIHQLFSLSVCSIKRYY